MIRHQVDAFSRCREFCGGPKERGKVIPTCSSWSQPPLHRVVGEAPIRELEVLLLNLSTSTPICYRMTRWEKGSWSPLPKLWTGRESCLSFPLYKSIHPRLVGLRGAVEGHPRHPPFGMSIPWREGNVEGGSLALAASLTALPRESHLLDEGLLLPLPAVLLYVRLLLAIHRSVQTSSLQGGLCPLDLMLQNKSIHSVGGKHGASWKVHLGCSFYYNRDGLNWRLSWRPGKHSS